MKCNKLLCLGMAVTLVCSTLPRTIVQANMANMEEIAAEGITAEVSENSMQDEESGNREDVPVGGDSAMAAEGLYDEYDWWINDRTLMGYTGFATELVIPDGVTSIGWNAFSRCSSLTIYGTGSYTESIQKTFTITASDGGSENPTNQKEPQKGMQTLSVAKTSYNKAYGNGAFNLGVKREAGDGALTYKTSDKKVADVDATGKVTIKGTGSATITVTVSASANYNASQELKITVNVSPAKQTVKTLKTAKGRKLTVSWKKDTKADGYEIQYSMDKKFKKSVKKTSVKSNKTTSKTLTKLTAGKKYYVRVCAYKTAKVNGKSTKLYGAWSGVKTSKKIKK